MHLAELDGRLSAVSGRVGVVRTEVALGIVGGAGAAARRLEGYEHRRWTALRRAADRDDYLAAHSLVREMAGRILGPSRTISLRQDCAGCGGSDHGRPRFGEEPDLDVSLAHARGWVGAVVADARCGIDVEPVSLATTPVLAALTTAERADLQLLPRQRQGRAFLRLWTRKEALVKAGRVRVEDFASTDVRESPVADTVLVDVPGPREIVAAVAVVR